MLPRSSARIAVEFGHGGNDQQFRALDFADGRGGVFANSAAGAQILLAEHGIEAFALQHDIAAGIDQCRGQHVGHAVADRRAVPASGRIGGLVLEPGHGDARLGPVVVIGLGIGHAAARAFAHLDFGTGLGDAIGGYAGTASARMRLEIQYFIGFPGLLIDW